LSAPAVYVGTILRMKTMTTDMTTGSPRGTNQAVYEYGITVRP